MAESNLMDYSGPRTPYEFEWEDLVELERSIFFRDSTDFHDGARRWPMSLRKEARENVFAMFYGDKPVSAIGRLERDVVIYGSKLRIGYIGGVCTHPDHRNRGLAGTVLSATINRFHENNVDFVCISGDRKLYRDAGSRIVGGVNRFVIRKSDVGNIQEKTINYEIATKKDAKILSAIYEKENLRLVRPLSDYEIILEYGHCAGKPVEFFLTYLNSLPVAYILITKLLKDGTRAYKRVVEYAGNREAVFIVLKKMVDEMSENVEVEIDIQNGDFLGKLMEWQNIYNEPATKPGTFCVIDFARTMSKLKTLFQSQLPDDVVDSLHFAFGKERYVLWCNDGSLEIDGLTNMVWTILGVPPGEKISNVKATGIMQEALKAYLPVPLPPLEMNLI